MALDLSALDAQRGATGEPLDIELALIDSDPNQPRRRFDRKGLEELAASIRERAAKGLRGVISPVSVRANPDTPGRWILNHGERRLRASEIAGQRTIPAVVDADHDEDDQVLENLQREDLDPMELAGYIARQLERGRKAADLARRLGVPKATITLHKTLATLPPALRRLYDADLCRSPRLLYDLERLHCKHSDAVERWAGTRVNAVTTRDVEAFRGRLASKKALPPTPKTAEKRLRAPEMAVEALGACAKPEQQRSERTTRLAGSARAPEGMQDVSSRRLLVRHGNREATVLLERSRFVLRFDDGSELEAQASDVTLERLDGG